MPQDLSGTWLKARCQVFLFFKWAPSAVMLVAWAPHSSEIHYQLEVEGFWNWGGYVYRLQRMDE